MSKFKEVTILILDLYSEFDENFESAVADLKYEHILLTKSIDEFQDSLLFEPVDLVLISAAASKQILLDKAIAISQENNLPIALISEDSIQIAELPLIKRSNSRDELPQLIENMGFKSNSSSSIQDSTSDQKLIDDSIFVKSNQQYKRILYKDILFIKSDHVYLEIHTLKDKYLVRASFKEYAEKLPTHKFYRAHKSYMVNIDHISVINQSDVVINQVHIPISRDFKAFITKSIKT